MKREEISNLLNPDRLQLIVLPTENCNFRCTYCYEDFEIGRMEDKTVEAIKKLIDIRLPKLKHLQLTWFGGEPLIAKDIVTDLTGHAQQAASAMGVSFTSDMTTNAYTLNRATFESLAALGVRSYQISLDGDEIEHNKTRKLISGKGSFEKIWANLLSMRDSSENFNVLLRVHVHTENVASVKDILSKIQHEFGQDMRFQIHLKDVGNWGGESVKAMNLLKSSKKDVMDDLKIHLEQIGWYKPRNVGTGGGGAGSGVYTCYAALPTSFVIRADGSLAKCTVAFNDERNRVGKINDDGTLMIENGQVQQFMRGFKNLNAKELGCPINGMPTKTPTIKAQPVQFYTKTPVSQ